MPKSISVEEQIGGGVNLDKVEEDQEFAKLTSMSVEEIEAMLAAPAEGEPEAEITTPESEQAAAQAAQEPQTPPADTVEGGEPSAPQTEDERLEAELLEIIEKGKEKPAPKAEEPAPATPDKVATVPQQALHAARKDGQQAKEQAKTLEQEIADARAREAYLLGQIEALKTTPQAPAAPAEPERQVGHVDAEINNHFTVKEQKLAQLAKDFDNSEFGMVEYRQKEKEVLKDYNDSILPLVQERNQLTQPKQSQPSAEEINGDVWLQQNTEALRNDHPWLFDETITQPLWNALTEAATQRMQSRGQAVVPTPQSTLALRRTIAEVGEEWDMHRRYAQAASPAPIAGQGQPQAMPNAEDRISKIRMAQGHPPNISQAGSPTISEDASSRLEGTSSADIVNQVSSTSEIERLLKLGS